MITIPLKLQILFSICSILYLILAYYGYIRYLSLHMLPCEKYAKTYLEVPRALGKSKIIISIGTDNTDFEHLKPTLNSILDQTVRPDQIILSNSIGKMPNIPSFLQTNKILILHNLQADYKQLNPLLSPLSREKDAETKIIIISESQIYGTDFVETLVEESDKLPNSVVFVKGYNAKKSLEKGERVSTPYDNDVIDVSGGVLIKPKFFEEDILDIENQPKNVLENIDVFLSSYLHKKKIQMSQINYNENFKKNNKLSPDSAKLISYNAILFPSFS